MNKIQVQELRRLKLRLTTVLLLATAILAAAVFLYYRHYRAHLLADAGKLLHATAVFKTDQILNWRRDRLDRTASLLESPILSIYLEKLSAAPGDRETASLLKRRLESFVDHNQFDAAILTDAAGRIRVSAGKKPMEALCPEASALVRSLPSAPVMGDLHRKPGSGEHGLHIAAHAAGGRRDGLYLLLSIKPETQLYPLVQKWPGASHSGETLLVRREGNGVVFLNELRHAKGTALKLRLPLKPDLPAAMAAQGITGTARGTDYRGKAVLSHLSALPEFGWYMVTKVDMEEVLANTEDLEILLLLGVLLFMGAVGAGAYAVFSGQTVRLSGELLKVSAERLKALQDFEVVFRTSADGKSITSMDGKVEPNLAFCEMTGYTQEELRRKNWRDITPKADIAHAEAILKDLLEGRTDRARFEKRYIRKDGEIIWGDVSVAVHRGRDGKPEYFITSILDVTARKAAETELREREAFIRAVMDNLPVGIAVNSTRESVKFQYINDRFPQFYRTTREALKEPDAFWEAVYEDPAFRERIRKRVLDDCASGDPARMFWENIPLTRGGDTRYITARNIPLPGKDLMISMVEDVTARKLSELRIEELNRDLTRKNKEMENFLYVTTHDLRSPLVNIQGFSRNLAGYLEDFRDVCSRVSGLTEDEHARLREVLTGKAPEALGFILDSSRKMDTLISALLQVSRAGRLELKPELLDMRKLLENVLATMRFQAQEAGAEISVGELPDCFADAGAVNQIFSNLLDNALRHATGVRRPEINVSGKISGREAVYTVEDNGPGIPADDLPKVWDMFYRPPAAGAGRGGAGIGLPLVRRLAERNGGSAAARAGRSGGAAFIITLPGGERSKR